MKFALSLLLVASIQGASSFIVFPCPHPKTTSHFGYSEGSDYGNEALLQKPKARGLTIPVMPAVPNALPLMMGSSLELDPPTLGQWQALEESVTLHQKYLQGANLTAINAAPVVAIIDEYTAEEQPAGTPYNHKVIRRYATIAAVVGISASQKVSKEKDFMEIMLGCKGSISPLASKIRLVGVGRADLTDFFYQMPTELELDDDVECSIEDLEDFDDLPPLIEEDRQDPIVMAEFSIINDDPKSSLDSMHKIGEKGARSPQMAPVFRITEMAKFANKVTRLHDDRRRWVNLVASAKMRLTEQNMFDDADGIGTISGGLDLLDETERLLQCENYGLNYYSSFSSIPDLTGVAQDVLENYYSPTRRSTEEYRLEVLSFVAFRSLEGYCNVSELAWALTQGYPAA